MTPRPTQANASTKGFALIAVLWMVAALSVLAAGLIKSLRSEIGSTQQLLESTRASATANAAIHLTIRDLLAEPAKPRILETRSMTLDALPTSVDIIPTAGLIDVNEATTPLLEALFRVAGGAEAAHATALATQIVQRRKRTLTDPAATAPLTDHAAQRQTRRERFDVIEDLLQTPGVSLDLFARIRDLVTVGSGQALVFPAAAPPAVLNVLAEGNSEAVARFVQARATGNPLLDASSFEHRTDSGPAGARYRLDASVSMPSGARYRRSAIVDLSADDNDKPYRILDIGPLLTASQHN